MANEIMRKTNETDSCAIYAEQASRILVVDDDFDMRLLLRWALSDAGYIVLEAQNGRDAIGYLPEFKPDLIVSDIRMPVMDGIEMCGFLHNSSCYYHIPVVLISSQSEKTKKECLALSGALCYIRKPFAMRDVLHQIRMCLQQTRFSS